MFGVHVGEAFHRKILSVSVNVMPIRHWRWSLSGQRCRLSRRQRLLISFENDVSVGRIIRALRFCRSRTVRRLCQVTVRRPSRQTVQTRPRPELLFPPRQRSVFLRILTGVKRIARDGFLLLLFLSVLRSPARLGWRQRRWKLHRFNLTVGHSLKRLAI